MAAARARPGLTSLESLLPVSFGQATVTAQATPRCHRASSRPLPCLAPSLLGLSCMCAPTTTCTRCLCGPDTEEASVGPAPCSLHSHSDGGHREFIAVHQQRLLGCMAPVGSWARSKDKACFRGCVQGRPFRGVAPGRGRGFRGRRSQVCVGWRDGHVPEPRLVKGLAPPAPGAGASRWRRFSGPRAVRSRGAGWRKQGPHRASGRSGSAS